MIGVWDLGLDWPLGFYRKIVILIFSYFQKSYPQPCNKYLCYNYFRLFYNLK